jgi:hypothetical protein
MGIVPWTGTALCENKAAPAHAEARWKRPGIAPFAIIRGSRTQIAKSGFQDSGSPFARCGRWKCHEKMMKVRSPRAIGTIHVSLRKKN